MRWIAAMLLLLATVDPTLGCMSRAEAQSMYPRRHLYWSVGAAGRRCWDRSLRAARQSARRPVAEPAIAEVLDDLPSPSIVPDMHVMIDRVWMPMPLPQDRIDNAWAELPADRRVASRPEQDRTLMRVVIALVAAAWLVVLGILVWRYGRYR